MFGLTQLGIVHTLISLIAVVAGIACFLKAGRIVPASTAGKIYIATTILTCVTGFGIFAHGGFGKPHVLGIITLLVLAVAWLGDRGKFGRASIYVATLSYSATFLFHMIPAITETSTRLPLGAPLLASAEAPELKTATGVLLLLFVIGAALQVRALRAGRAKPAGLSAAGAS